MKIEISDIVLRKNSSEPILQGITTSFTSPEFTILSGPNGSGKSMLLRVLVGLEKPDSGTVLVGGRPYPQAYGQLGSLVGMVFQQPHSQILGQTVREDILFSLNSVHKNKDKREERCREILAWAGLSEHENQNPHTLSGGELRRLSLASALALEPQFILFDEPFNGLDYFGVQNLLKSMIDLHNQGKGILVVTHHLDQVLAHADRLLVLKECRILADGIPQRILPHLEDHGVRKPSGKLPEMSWL